ncbi:MAG: helix-turn-helix domain-containing protein [Gammaproteobacteria bacterium]|nr:helix-turn-helix domain-containing protein [Gammaproteobacteria bacterium]
MKTLDLHQAAQFLRMNPEALRQKAKAGEVPGAKPGKCWVFVEEDLVEYIRSQYACPRQAVRVTNVNEEAICHSTVDARRGGSTSRRPVVSEYAKALGLKSA